MSKILGTNVAAPLVPFDTADSYPTHDALYGVGGWREVATLADRDAIPAARRRVGMRVVVQTDGKVWGLEADGTWADKTAIKGDAGTGSGASSGRVDPKLAPGRKFRVHRFGAQMAPENTMAAAENAVRLGLLLLETDCHFTSDNVAVISHDATVDRCTNGTGRIDSMTLAQIKTLDAGSKFSSRFAGEPIPTVQEALLFVRRVGADMSLEVKQSTTAQATSLIQMIIDMGLEDQVGVSNVSTSMVRSMSSRIRVSVGLSASNVDNLGPVKALAPVSLSIDYRDALANPTWIQKVIAAGLEPPTAYTVNFATFVAQLEAIGISTFTGDNDLRNA